jgi:Lar family restriction alleviation protein
MSEAKPCPFCGKNTAILCEPENEDEYGVMCNYCGAQGGLDEDGEYAIVLWNTRPIEDALRAELDELRERYRWRDMASAPKDGTFILIRHKDTIDKAWWGRCFNPCVGRTYPAWMIYGMESEEYGTYQTIDKPLGWMPLPEPPETTE